MKNYRKLPQDPVRFSKITCNDLADRVAMRYFLPRKMVRKLFLYYWRNVIAQMRRRNDVQLIGLGQLYITKKIKNHERTKSTQQSGSGHAATPLFDHGSAIDSF